MKYVKLQWHINWRSFGYIAYCKLSSLKIEIYKTDVGYISYGLFPSIRSENLETIMNKIQSVINKEIMELERYITDMMSMFIKGGE